MSQSNKPPAISEPSALPVIDVMSTEAIPESVETFATLYYQAFAEKLDHLELFSHSDAQAITIISECLNLHRGICAVSDGSVIAVAGLEYGGQRFVTFRWTALLRSFGLPGGLWGYLWIKLLRLFQRPQASALRIEAIAVSETARGKGVGTLLLERIFDFARALGYQAIVLEVVNTNTAAHKLYERFGFTTVRTSWYGPITAPAGFTGAHYM
jgi:ribosomal protein S18 acetylase RimI-like enzyme